MPCNIISHHPSSPHQQKCVVEKKLKRRVSFPESEEDLVAVRHVSMAEELLWMDEAEFQAVREQANIISDQNRDKGFSKLLAPNEKPDVAQVKLDLWAKMENEKNLRGLERYVNSEHRDHRDSIVRQAVQAVLEAQQQAKENGTEQEVELIDLLAPISLQYSTTCAEFAQMIAKADAKAVHQRSRCRSISPKVSRSRPRSTKCRSISPKVVLSRSARPRSVTE